VKYLKIAALQTLVVEVTPNVKLGLDQLRGGLEHFADAVPKAAMCGGLRLPLATLSGHWPFAHPNEGTKL
jgi:hypothetical protein